MFLMFDNALDFQLDEAYLRLMVECNEVHLKGEDVEDLLDF